MKQGNTKYQMSLAKCARKLEHYSTVFDSQRGYQYYSGLQDASRFAVFRGSKIGFQYANFAFCNLQLGHKVLRRILMINLRNFQLRFIYF